MKPSKLTYVAFELNALKDSGRDVSIGEMQSQIVKRRVFEFLEQTFADDIDLSMLDAADRRYFSEQWEDLHLALGHRAGKKLGVERDGLCLLQGFTIELIQRAQLN